MKEKKTKPRLTNILYIDEFDDIFIVEKEFHKIVSKHIRNLKNIHEQQLQYAKFITNEMNYTSINNKKYINIKLLRNILKILQ